MYGRTVYKGLKPLFDFIFSKMFITWKPRTLLYGKSLYKKILQAEEFISVRTPL
jgi:hypothetical protein